MAEPDRNSLRNTRLGLLATLFAVSCSPGIGDGSRAEWAILRFPSGIAVDGQGIVYVAEREGHRIRRIGIDGTITTIVGTGEPNYSGDGGPASRAKINSPEIMRFHDGTLYFSDRANFRVRSVDLASGLIRTVAGNGVYGYDGDGGPATEARISHPFGISLDSDGNLYIADTENHRIRRFNASTGIINTVAGTGEAGFSGDRGPAVAASLRRPHAVATTPTGNLLIADSCNQRLRLIDLRTGLIDTVAGTGSGAGDGDGGLALEAGFAYFGDLAYDPQGNLLITSFDGRVRRIGAVTDTITTIAGTGEPGFWGDWGPARHAQFNLPYGIAVDLLGNIYVADARNNRVRRIEVITGMVTTHAGIGRH